MTKIKKHKIKQDPELWKKLDELRSSNENFKSNSEYKSVRSKLAELNYPIVLKISDLIHHKYPEADKDDLKGFGALGLIDAIDKFDPYKDIGFETYASYRIVGSMFDEMRKLDWIPRLTRQRHAIVEKEKEKFIILNGRNPTREELISLIDGESVPEKEKIIEGGTIKYSYSINKSSNSDEDEEFSTIHFDKRECPLLNIDRKDFFMTSIAKKIEPKESQFIYLVYYEGRTFKEAAKIVGIKENQSSYFHDAIIKKLEKIFEKDIDILAR